MANIQQHTWSELLGTGKLFQTGFEDEKTALDAYNLNQLLNAVLNNKSSIEENKKDIEDKLGESNGIATLDNSGKVTSTQIPDFADNSKLTKDNIVSKLTGSITSHSHPDTSISWGTTNIAGGVSPIDAAASNFINANRFAFANPNGIIIQYLQEGQTSYTNYDTTNEHKVGLVSGIDNIYYFVGGRQTGNQKGDRLQITFDAANMGVRAKIQKLLLNISTGYATNCKVDVDYSTVGNSSSFSGTVTSDISGWTGWNSIAIGKIFGGADSNNVARIRLTFYGNPATGNLGALSVRGIVCIGDTLWEAPAQSTMARTGHMYTYDSSKNVSFPARVTATDITATNKVTATEFVGKLTGNADTATTATKSSQDGQGVTISTNYAKLANPAFTGTPTAPTATKETRTTQIATTDFVHDVVDDAIDNLDIDDVTLSNYYTKSEIDAVLEGVSDNIVVSETEPVVTGGETIWLQPIEQDIDYIIEQSISDDVYYEKWHSGIVKYYAKETHQVYGDGGDTISSGRLSISTDICKKVITHNVTATNLTSNAKVDVTCGETETTPTDLILTYTLYFASMTSKIETSHAIIGRWK